ncbi:MAG: hypothetical protein KF751_10595 [Nitrospira sp.]|nr:hypothetical protein [Nitrospira sp.]
MTDWSLPNILSSLHTDVEHALSIARSSFGHAPTTGAASENVWLTLLKKYLPLRYSAANAHVVDSNGQFSEQIDVVIFDRQYSPFIFHFQHHIIIPAESIYAVFETKQSLTLHELNYAQTKISSVRSLHRTSLPIPTASGEVPPKPLHHILGGILTLESEWSPPLGQTLAKHLAEQDPTRRLDLGCVAAHGIFRLDTKAGIYQITPRKHAATAFLFELIASLQSIATVPMLDVRAYAKWLP